MSNPPHATYRIVFLTKLYDQATAADVDSILHFTGWFRDVSRFAADQVLNRPQVVDFRFYLEPKSE